MGSPPKPWERAGAGAVATSSAPSLPSTSTPVTTSSAPTAPTSSTQATTTPTVPERPSSLPTTSTSATSPYSSPYNRVGGGLGMGSYGGYGMGSMYGGGMGGYGSMGYGMGGYGGYGGMYGSSPYGMGGMYGGMQGPYGMGMGMDPNNPSLTQTLSQTTEHTFLLLHSIVQTFSGVAQMLESSFMATHSSFFAMVGVVDQFTQLRNAVGGVLGLFGLVRSIKELLGLGGGAGGMRGEFKDFRNGKPIQGPAAQPAPGPKASKKPLFIFLLAIFGVPWAMTRLIRALAARQAQANPNGLPSPSNPNALQPGQQIDPSSLTFARALHPFTASNGSELSLKENEIVAIMGKFDPKLGQEVLFTGGAEIDGDAEWWKGRTRDGREGWFPRKWVEVLPRKEKVV
ncbi:Peroxisomal membrane protein PAS20 [Paramarasmius palmivorus]|uniref:Peroxisomal membrane protein PEX13 n=1 Tax=Paramarasmius palmivorus TaxID=297713 RepID=A0AAW0DK69_9AGAR